MRIRNNLLVALILLSSLIAANAFSQVKESPPKNMAMSATVDSITQTVANVQLADSIEAASGSLVPFEKEIRKIAFRHRLPASLLAAFIQEESVFDPWATRTEPGYLKNKLVKRNARAWSLAHNGIPTATTELHDRSRSMGLMQPMGELAREQGFDARYLSMLYLPENSIEQGALLLQRLLKRYPGDTLSAISAYNQGNNRKKHGVFANARYVYRVAIAREQYHDLFITHTRDLNQALYDTATDQTLPNRWSRYTDPDFAEAQLSANTRAKGENNIDSNHASAIAARHGDGTRYTLVSSRLHSGQSEPTDPGKLFVLVTLGIAGAACLYFFSRSYLRFLSGYDSDEARHAEGVANSHARHA